MMVRKCIETEIWEDIPDKPHMVRYVEQRPAQEVFNELEDYLSQKGLVPDDYFLLSIDCRDGQKFPKGNIICHADYGGNEGIYLDIVVNGENGTKRFATGKTLSDSDAAMNRMSQVACECTKVFAGCGTDETVYVHSITKQEHDIILDHLSDAQKDNSADEQIYQLLGGLIDKLEDHSGTLLPQEIDEEMEM